MYKVYVRSSNEHIGSLVGSSNYPDDAMAIARVWQDKPHVSEVRVDGPVYLWNKPVVDNG